MYKTEKMTDLYYRDSVKHCVVNSNVQALNEMIKNQDKATPSPGGFDLLSLEGEKQKKVRLLCSGRMTPGCG